MRMMIERTRDSGAAIDEYLGYFQQYSEYDPFLTPVEPPNPWITDSTEYWDQEKLTENLSAKRVRRWAFSIYELLKDPAGKEHFIKFLGKEFSDENLRFWDEVQTLKTLPAKDVASRCERIWNEYLTDDATSTINIDARSLKATKEKLLKPDRWSFDDAAGHVFHLMRSDTYSRYLRSDMYKEFLAGCKKKTTKTLFIPVFSNLNLGSSSSNTGSGQQQQASSSNR
ncbi:unnamed protein product [Notodromas monacha]|uniref:RGS domain-containing protein n=1 Tax=Notodromas monacha TaxID=399045 RepID=A0A7R9BDP5_9CRUS|nr:unnamed protein product [Notodromas monacha]CAG0913432.1 unnamed protein product [Notodromas monacha]